MNGLINLWAGIYVVALVAFYLLVLFIIPSGYKDLCQLFRDLRSGEPHEDDKE